jgi:NADH dehydrogenase
VLPIVQCPYVWEDAIAIDKKLRQCLQQARKTKDPEQRRRLLTVVIVGGGPSGIEMACTLADLLPNWYQGLGGNSHEIRVVLLNHGQELLTGDVNSGLREVAEQELQNVPCQWNCSWGSSYSYSSGFGRV